MAFNYYNLAYFAPLISVMIILVVLFAFFPMPSRHPNISTATTEYNVTFNEVGLPKDIQWGITFGGHQFNSTPGQNQITVTGLTSGNYIWTTWSIPCGNGCRYTPTQLAGSISVPGESFQTIRFVKQFNINLEPIFQDNPSISPSFYYMALGSQNTIHLVNSSLWVDANTLWYVSPVLIQGSSGQERWITSQGSGTVTGPQNININYYHQFLISYDVITSDSSVIPTPIHLTAQSFGTILVQSLGMGINKLWLDSATNWKVDASINGTTGLERWMLAVPSSGVIAAPVSITLPYIHQYYLSFIVSPQSSGYVNVSDGWFNAGKITIAAIPSANYGFDRWYSDNPFVFISNLNTPVTDVIVHGAGNITAFFNKPSNSFFFTNTQQQSVYLTVEAGTGGSVTYSYGQNTGSVSQGSKTALLLPVGTNVCLTAIPMSGYTFAGWNNSLLGNANPYCFTVYANMTIHADFSNSTQNNNGGSSGEGTTVQSVPEFPFGSLPITAATFLLLLFLSSRIRRKNNI
jgi:hypothetical protein